MTIDSGDTKKCPFCAELIKAEAIKCKHCGSEIPAQTSSPHIHAPPGQFAPPQSPGYTVPSGPAQDLSQTQYAIPPKDGAVKILGFGCLGFVILFVVSIFIGASVDFGRTSVVIAFILSLAMSILMWGYIGKEEFREKICKAFKLNPSNVWWKIEAIGFGILFSILVLGSLTELFTSPQTGNNSGDASKEKVASTSNEKPNPKPDDPAKKDMERKQAELMAEQQRKEEEARRLAQEKAEQEKDMERKQAELKAEQQRKEEEARRLAQEKAEQERLKALAPPESQFEWVPKVQENCASYVSAPNEIKQSAIFRKNEALLKSVKINNATGKLKVINTSQGGSQLSIHIEVGKANFETESLFAPINSGSKVYNQVSEMTEGQCVVFSAIKIESSSLLERSKVCDLDYYAEFSEVKNCE